MKKILLLCFIIGFVLTIQFSSAQVGIGVKFGDPLAVSGKAYFGNKALEINLGVPYYVGGYNHNYYYTHDNRYKNKYYWNYGYDRRSAVAIQGHFLIQKDIKQLDGLQWYFGGGPQIRFIRGTLYYYDVYGYHEDAVTDVDFGLDGVIGLEYTFKDIPLSIFTDFNLFFELIDRPYVWAQGGFGIRYNFE